jgi:hypothetical protein
MCLLVACYLLLAARFHPLSLRHGGPKVIILVTQFEFARSPDCFDHEDDMA